MALTFFGRRKSGTSTPGGPTDGGDDPASRQMRAMLAEVRAYWEGLRDGPALPRRDQIDPRGLRGALQGTFLLERIAPGVGRLRIAGMNFADLLGMDGRGMPLSALFDPMSRNRLGTLLDACFLRPATLELTLGCETGLGRPALSARMILLPVACDDGRGEMALGCLALSGQIGRQPRRLGIEAASCTPIALPRLAALHPVQDLARLARMPHPLPEQALPSDGPQPSYAVKPSAKARSYLKLVDLGR
ncbi:MAG: PAS domain-containing protein [Gemmobacter sp.]|uniref:PAS domain-containing protein n=1 Tax=Gemmobacter sp. TaxID=1898957 RepID=UPI001A4B3AB8|nr:PAS domain-containing protein [Gemmobacter sp.]MBL8563745.1 PAS domain-containing protein [Gemmobacter sp.]